MGAGCHFKLSLGPQNIQKMSIAKAVLIIECDLGEKQSEFFILITPLIV